MIYGYLSSKEKIQLLKGFKISGQNIYVAREELFNAVKSGDIIIFNNIDEIGNDFEIKSNFDSLIARGIIF